MSKRPRSASPPAPATGRGNHLVSPLSPPSSSTSQVSSITMPRDEVDNDKRNGQSKGKGRAAPSPSSSSSPLGDLFGYQEIFLRILSFLPPSDLASGQRVNRYWSNMTLDPQLWKRLYLARYPHPHHSRLIYGDPRVSGSSGGKDDAGITPRRRGLRPISRLPSRAFPPPSPSRPGTPSRSSVPPSPSPARDEPTSTLSGAMDTPAETQSDVQGDTTQPVDGDKAADDKRTDGEGGELGWGVRNDGVDWKMMLRLETNWSHGNALSETTLSLPPSPSPTVSSDHLTDNDNVTTRQGSSPSSSHSQQHIALSPSFIFSSHPDSPLIHVYASNTPSTVPLSLSQPKSGTNVSTPLGIIPPPPGWSSPHRPDNITAICTDQAVSLRSEDDPGADETTDSGAKSRTRARVRVALPTRLAAFYQSGGFVILHLQMGSSRLVWVRESISPPIRRPRSVRHRRNFTTYTPIEGDPVVLAVMHYPVVVTCTLAFHLSVYTTTTSPTIATDGASPSRPHRLSTMHSDTSFHPAALSLFPRSTIPSLPRADSTDDIVSRHFDAALTYCTPLYPSSWTVAVQEIDISLDKPSASTVLDGLTGPTLGGSARRGECFTVLPSEDLSEGLVWPRRIKPVVGVKGKSAVGVGTDGRWCVLAGEDNQIQVYSLPTPSPSPPPPPTDPALSSYEPLPDFGSSSHLTLNEDRAGLTGPGIVHSQSLLAHSSAVTSISLMSGRCISGGRDGRVLVWELDDPPDEDDEQGQGHAHGHYHAAADRGRKGRTVGYVEVRTGGGRRRWHGASGPLPPPPLFSETSTPRASTSNKRRKVHSSRVSGMDDGEDGDKDNDNDDDEVMADEGMRLPHPASISSAARSLFLPRPPETAARDDRPPPIKQLVFDEEKIVGLISVNEDDGSMMQRDPQGGSAVRSRAEVMKVWSFNS